MIHDVIALDRRYKARIVSEVQVTVTHFITFYYVFHGSKDGWCIYQGSKEAGNVPFSLCSSNLDICGKYSAVKDCGNCLHPTHSSTKEMRQRHHYKAC